MRSPLLAVVSLTLLCMNEAMGWASDDPTNGFVELPLNSTNFDIQAPRMEFTGYGFSPLTGLSPSQGYDYSSGIWQFEGYGYVPNGTSGVCIMQLFGASHHATTVMVRVYNGSLTYYRDPVLVPCIYDKWFRLNVIHDVGARKVKIYINGILKLEVEDRGGASHYFKFGVYAQNDASHCMESRWKGIRILKKCD